MKPPAVRAHPKIVRGYHMRLLAKLCLISAVAATVTALPGSGEAQTVASLRGQLDRAGQRLDQAAEAYNKASVTRSHLDAKLTTARADVTRSQNKLHAARGKLGVAVRNLYEHPAS